MYDSHPPLFEIRRFPRGDGEIWPCLLRKGLPILLPNLWIDELCISARPNTVESYLRDILIIYNWATSELINLDERFKSLRGLSNSELSALAFALCTTKVSKNPASRATCVRRLESVKNFIRFAFDHHIENIRPCLADQAQAEKNCVNQIKKLSKKINHFVNLSPEPRSSSNLSTTDLDTIESIINPDSPFNPFKEQRVRIRNYCLFLVAIETFARRSEIVLLEFTDVELSDQPTITIKHPSAANRSKRRDGASLKTKGRVIPISLELANLLGDYIDKVRKDFLFPRRPTTALFLSTKDGRRLSANTFNQILTKISRHPNSDNVSNRIHPHGLRATGANILRRKIKLAGKSSGVDLVESMSYLGGWVQDSPMVRQYTRTALSESLGSLVRSENKKTGKPIQ